MSRRAIPPFVLLCVLTALLVLPGCRPSAELTPGGTGGDASKTVDLGTVEVQEYKGRKLGSIEDFRENSIKGPQSVDPDTYRLTLAGLVTTPTELTYDDVIALPAHEKVVRLNCVEGWSVDVLWEGVLLTDVLEQAGGASRSANTVVFRCADGYSTSLPLEFVRDRKILLAYKMNGVVLPEERGYPFQVVAEDKWGYKWAKWVTSIELGDDPDFEGYWESRGYDNDATLPSKK